MASISSLGIGSGLDAESIISSLMSVERRPIDLITSENKTLSTQVSAVGKLQSYVDALKTKSEAITGIGLWNTKAFKSADETVVTGSASGSAAGGSYSMSVQQMAAAQTVTASQAMPSAASTLNEGSLTITLGAWSGTSFSAKSGATPVTVNIGAGETSLAAIRDKINAAGAGIKATIVNDANGARLSLRSAETGAENGFKITATETTDDGDVDTGLSSLGFDRAAVDNPTTLNQLAANARATINGISVESTSNTFTDVADGLSLTVGKVSTSAVEVSVADDKEAIRTAVKEFVTAYNDLANYIREQTKYDATSKTGGTLQGDRTTIALQWQLRGVINQGSSASSEWSRLSEVGITMKQDGTLSVKTSALDTALEDPAELRKLLATDGTSSANSGFMDRFRDLAKAVNDTTTGLLQLREDGLNAQIKRNEKRITQMEDRLTDTEKRVRAQYQALDTSMAKLSSLSSYVTQQLSSLYSNNS
ncbi:flagellar filament capping protein FliD [Ideonella livida]|uniref:Flagellar hook-associated protein 2 n=1 Tax=Ideonella livida TaxID=2707176 RepID=A0A7C9TJY5_9BURK|nr:flagellar filament capping protein FliD [Ideonella livida]NDY92341.1 flagellar filament capping protein FliD [Ideonella livida]